MLIVQQINKQMLNINYTTFRIEFASDKKCLKLN